MAQKIATRDQLIRAIVDLHMDLCEIIRALEPVVDMESERENNKYLRIIRRQQKEMAQQQKKQLKAAKQKKQTHTTKKSTAPHNTNGNAAHS